MLLSMLWKKFLINKNIYKTLKKEILEMSKKTALLWAVLAATAYGEQNVDLFYYWI